MTRLVVCSRFLNQNTHGMETMRMAGGMVMIPQPGQPIKHMPEMNISIFPKNGATLTMMASGKCRKTIMVTGIGGSHKMV